MTPDTLRARTLSALKNRDLSPAPPLPLLEMGMELRGTRETAMRANVMHVLYALSLHGNPSLEAFRELIQQNGWEDHLCPTEKELLDAGELTPSTLIQFSWFKESIKALLWAGSMIDTDITRHIEECDFARFYALIPPELPVEDYLKKFSLKGSAEMFEALDFFYCLHWFCRNEPEKVAAAPEPINPSVVLERRRALEWLTQREDWGRILLDT